MNLNGQSSVILQICLLLPLITGISVLVWGRKLLRQGDWLIGISFLVAAVGIAFSFAGLSEQALHVRIWTRGWIWPKAETGSIVIGVVEDSLGLAMAALSIAVASIFLSNRAYLSREPRVERVYAGLGFSIFGVSIAWIAATPWVAFIGVLGTVFGGFLAMGSRWDGEAESEVAIRFAWERVSGIVLTVIGACGLAGARIGLNWIDESAWNGIGSLAHPIADRAAASVLLIGIFLQFQPFPLLGALVKTTDAPTSVRALIMQLFPAWSALALLFRFEPVLRSLDVLTYFGWAQLLAAALALGMGYAQKNWRTSFGAWITAGVSACAAVLALSGPINGIAIWIGFVLGTTMIALSGSTLAMGGGQSASHKTRALWTKICAFVGVAAATGMVGFVSSGAVVRSLVATWNQPFEWVSLLLVFVLFAAQGWQMVWTLARSKNTVQLPWTTILAPLLLGLLSFGIWWDGTASGGAVPGRPDQFLNPAVLSFFPSAKQVLADDRQFAAASLAFWGGFAVALVIAYFWAVKLAQKTKSTRVLDFLAGGYGVDSGVRRAFSGVLWLGARAEVWVDRRISSEWVPQGLFRAVRAVSRFAVRADAVLISRIDSSVRQCFDVPAKVLQLLQNGNVQWYLFFALASGMAILVHFLRI